MVRPCDWAASELSKFQAVPKDAKPITTWSNHDEAWLDAIEGIKCHLNSFKPAKLSVPTEVKNETIRASDAALNWIEDTEIVLTHRKVNKIKLGDVYISPDFEDEEFVESKNIEICSSDIIFKKPKKFLISGEEQQGKTSLLKHAFMHFLKAGIVPVYLDAKDVNKSDINKYLVEALKFQSLGSDSSRLAATLTLSLIRMDG